MSHGILGGTQIKLTTPSILTSPLGGSKSDSFAGSSLSRAKTDDKPRVRSQHKYKGDEILTRKGNKGAQVLGRMLKANPGTPRTAQRTIPKSVANQKVVTAPTQGLVPQTKVQPDTTAPTTPKTPMQKLEDTLSSCRKTFEELSHPIGKDELLTPKERLSLEADRETKRGDVKVKAELLLGDFAKSIEEKTKAHADLSKKLGANDPEVLKLGTEIAQLKDALKAARGPLADIQIKCELGAFGKVVDAPIAKGGVMTSLWSIHGPGQQTKDPLVSADIIKELGEGIDAFNSGATTFTARDGTVLDLAAFRDKVLQMADDIRWAQDGDLGSRAETELTKLADALSVKIEYQKTVKAFATLLEKAPGLSVGAAIMSLSVALPGLRRDGDKADLKSAATTANNLATLANMVMRGDVFPNMLGHDSSFDAACKKFQVDRGGTMAVDHLQVVFARGNRDWPSDQQLTAVDGRAKELLAGAKTSGTKFPSDELVAIALKPTDQLTTQERADLLNVLASPMTMNLDEARTIISAAQIITAHENGRAAATLRHDVAQMNIQLANILTADRRRLLHPSTWLDKTVKVLEHPLHGMPKDAKLMEALKRFGNDATGRDVAILIAHISSAERKLLQAENRAFGLYPNLDMQDRTPDPHNPLAHIGISNKDLARIGVTTEQLKDIDAVVQKLYTQGVGNVEDVQAFNKAINDVSKLVLKSSLTQDMILSYERDSARMVGQHLASELLSDAELSYRKKNNLPDPGAHTRPTTTDSSVVGHFKERVAGLRTEFNKTAPYSWDMLKIHAETYGEIETAIATSYRNRLDVDDNMKGYRTFLEEESGPTSPETPNKLGIDVNADSPRGLRSAKLILNALRENDNITNGIDVAGSRQRLEGYLNDLRGFDMETMRRPWYGKIAAVFNKGEKPTIQQLEKLADIAEAIVYVREDGPTEMERFTTEIEEHGLALDQMVEARKNTNPRAMQQVTDMVRTAVLSEWRNYGDDKKARGDFVAKKGSIEEGFNPAVDPDRAKILKTLEKWGLTGEDLERFAPEIDSVLFSRMTSDDIVAWAGEARWSSASIEQYKTDHPPRFSREGILQTLGEIRQTFTVDSLLNRKVMDDTTKNSLLSMLESFQEGDKLDLKSGQRITLDSGKIPVEPSGLVGIKAKLSGSHLGQFEIERGGDGYKLHLRTGFAGKGNLDAIVGHKFDMGGGVELTAQASAGVEGGGGKLTGVTLSFKNDDDGCRSLVELVSKMVDGEKIDLWDWQDATDVGSASEGRTKFGLNAALTGVGQIGGKSGVEVDGKKDTLGVGVSGQITGSMTRGTKSNTTESLKETTRKGEVEYSVTLGAGASVYARIYNPLNIATGFAATESGGQKGADNTFGKNEAGKSNYNITDNVQNTDLFGISISKSVTYTDKWKQVTDKNGLYTKCETVRQANIRQGVWQAFAACDTPEMQRVLNQDKEFAANFKVFMDLTGPDDFIQVTYSIKEDKLKEANDLLNRSRVAEREGKTDLAEALADKARKIVNSDQNYIPAKIGLVSTGVQSSEIVNLNARWISWSTFSDGKMEHTGATLTIPKPK